MKRKFEAGEIDAGDYIAWLLMIMGVVASGAVAAASSEAPSPTPEAISRQSLGPQSMARLRLRITRLWNLGPAQFKPSLLGAVLTMTGLVLLVVLVAGLSFHLMMRGELEQAKSDLDRLQTKLDTQGSDREDLARKLGVHLKSAKSRDEIILRIVEPGVPIVSEAQRSALDRIVKAYKPLLERGSLDIGRWQDVGLQARILAAAQRKTGDIVGASDTLENTVAVLSKWAGVLSQEPDLLHELAMTYNDWGILRGSMLRPKEANPADWLSAEALYGLALEKQLLLVDAHPDRADYARALARTYNNVGEVLRKRGQFSEAERAYRKSNAVRQELINRNRHNIGDREDIALTTRNIGVLLKDMVPPRLQEAADCFRQVLKEDELLITEDKNEPRYRHSKAITLYYLGTVLIHKGKDHYKDGKALLETSREELEKLLIAEPSRLDYHDLLGLVLGNLARMISFDVVDARREVEKLRRVQKLLVESVHHHQTAVRSRNVDLEWQQHYRVNYLMLVQVHALLGAHQEAASAISTFPEFLLTDASGAEQCRRFAGILALCSVLVAADTKLTEDSRASSKMAYCDSAMKYLQLAVERGYNDVNSLKQEKDLAPLRVRTDFQELIKRFEKKVNPGNQGPSKNSLG